MTEQLSSVNLFDTASFIDPAKYRLIYKNLRKVLNDFSMKSDSDPDVSELEILRKIQFKKLLNVPEVCCYLGVGETSVRALLNKPKNPYTVKVGNRLYANKDTLDKWLNQNSGNYNGTSIL